MASVRFSVDTYRLWREAIGYEEDSHMLLNELEAIKEGILALGTMWRGEANEALTETFNNAYGYAISFANDLLAFSNDVLEDERAYSECEARVSELVSGI